MTILAQDILTLGDMDDYKIHFARRSDNGTQPLEVWTKDEKDWLSWQEYRRTKNEFNRPYIFSLMRFYHETDMWLFGGVYRVMERHTDRYKVERTDIAEHFIGRLKIKYPYRDRATRVFMEKHYPSFTVHEILPEPYSGRVFPGYDAVNLSFDELETLVQRQSASWKAALGNIKGVYLITDTKTMKRYIGSAYGADGIWSRWSSYINTGHGGNAELKEIIKKNGKEYCKKNFRISLLEDCSPRLSDDAIIERECFWKDVLLSRSVDGLNRN